MRESMKLSFEKSRPGHGTDYLPPFDSEYDLLPDHFRRKRTPRLPEMSEIEVSRHYTELEDRTFGINDGSYLLGSCTMKYNPKINDAMASLPELRDVHPLAPDLYSQGSRLLTVFAESVFSEITGMDRMSFAPMAGAQGEFAALLMFRAYFAHKGEHRTKIIVPDTAHGTNPASAAMAGYDVITVPSNEEGGVDVEKMREVMSDDVAGLMLTNPNTLGLLDANIQEITALVHEYGGLNYYDGANLNPIMGISRPGDIGFDLVHLNLHKTFSTPHGGGGPGSGPVGCKEALAPFLPLDIPTVLGHETVAPSPSVLFNIFLQSRSLSFPTIELYHPEHSIGRVGRFYGNYLVVVRALTFALRLGKEGVPASAKQAVLNANYLLAKLKDIFEPAFGDTCMHEFVISLKDLKRRHGVDAKQFSKALQDYGIHPPTMYFPLNVPEALMIEPTETESKDRLDRIAEVFRELHEKALSEPEYFAKAPYHQPISQPDETQAARQPKLRYEFPADDGDA